MHIAVRDTWNIKFTQIMVDPFKNAYFVHELRGLKGGTTHAPEENVKDANDTDSEDLDHSGNPQQAFDVFFNNIDRAHIDPNNWFIDVSLKVYDPGMVVLWNKLAHPAILKSCHRWTRTRFPSSEGQSLFTYTMWLSWRTLLVSAVNQDDVEQIMVYITSMSTQL